MSHGMAQAPVGSMKPTQSSPSGCTAAKPSEKVDAYSCNESSGELSLVLDLEDPGDGSALQRPPSLAITMPSSVPCNEPTTFEASASDGDGDLADVQWYVDGVLMAPGVERMTFTETHEIEAVAWDERGAATTDRRSVSCY